MVGQIVSATRASAAILVLAAAVAACRPTTENGLAPADREQIVQDIGRVLEAYKESCTHKDLSAIKAFWSDAASFVFAGDGVILGGSKEWNDKLDWYDKDTAKWNYWVYRNLHVEVLAKDAASATVEFENSRTTTAGATVNVKGAWTYVFKKYDGKWRVIQGNGTHITS